jgi:glycosyltransferase involved in cell wall biosynthesis
LLAALAELRARGIAFTCDFAGGGELRRRVARDIARRKLGDRVRLLGNVPHRELTASLERGDYDLAVLASTERGNEHEGIPVALMEAMAAGLPVVATRTGSIPELVDAASGLLVEQRDPAALAAALEALTEHPERRARMGDFGRGRIVAAFSTVKTTRALEDLLLASAPWFGQEGTQRRGP